MVALLGLGGFLLAFPMEVTEAASDAIVRCLTIIIPSLFAFMVLATYLLESGVYVYVAKPFSWLARFVLRLDARRFTILMMGTLGGYPVGAKLMAPLVERGELSRRDAARLLCCCTMGGPSYLVSIVGAQLYGAVWPGMLLYVSMLLAHLLLAVFLAWGEPLPSKSPPISSHSSSAGGVIGAVNSTTAALARICPLILLTQVLLVALDKARLLPMGVAALRQFTTFTQQDADAILRSFFEISNCVSLTKGNLSILPLLAAISAFGGICVMLQVAGTSRGQIPLGMYMATRPLVAVLSAGICQGLMMLMGDSVMVWSSKTPTISSGSVSPAASLLLLILTVLLLFSTRRAEE